MILNYYTSLPLIATVSVVHPAYSTFKALQSKSELDLTRYLCYWLIFALISCVDFLLDAIGSFFPFYYEAKLALFLWLSLERFSGAMVIYSKMEPLLKAYEPEVDKAIASAYAYAKDFKVEDINKLITFVQEKVGAAAPAKEVKAAAPAQAAAADEQTEKPVEEEEVVVSEDAKKEQ